MLSDLLTDKTRALLGSDFRQCDACARLLVRGDQRLHGWHCEAFPPGEREIPMLILDGDEDHREDYPGDHGLRFVLSANWKADPYGEEAANA